MINHQVRTRFAPSPTGFMHVGNLRTALFEYLIAKSQNGDFILRIEDTDRKRFVKGAVEIIYNTLKLAGLQHDEGPDIGGKFAPYVQSERPNIYKSYAEKLRKEGKAYYCFCSKERLEALQKESGEAFSGYDRHCRNLLQDEIDSLLAAKAHYVIRQKMPLEGFTTIQDAVFGAICIENKELEDQVLIKSNHYPTYNFANVIDDHLMKITHVVRGSEFLTSTPKYQLLYDSFGWTAPIYVHLPLIMGQNEDGSTLKLGKRHGSTGFTDLVKAGYLPEAIVNYIAFLGWTPKGEKEIFSLKELIKEFSIEGISKSPSVFDYNKLSWINGKYIRNMSVEEFADIADPYFKEVFQGQEFDCLLLSSILQPRIVKLTDIPNMIVFLKNLPDYSVDIFVNKKSKIDLVNAKKMLKKAIAVLQDVSNWKVKEIYDQLISLAQKLEVKNGTLLWPVRIAASGLVTTPGGAIEILALLGKEESIARLKKGLMKLQNISF